MPGKPHKEIKDAMNKFFAKLKRLNKSKATNIILVWLMMLPGLAYLFFNNYLPMYGITIAFKRLDFSLPNVLASPYIGFENFEFLFESEAIWTYVRNTVLYNAAFILLNIFIPVSLAVLFTTIRGKRIKGVYQTLILLPHLMSWVVVTYMAFALFSGENGLFNSMIEANGGTRINFYGRNAQPYWPFILVFFNMWKGTGFIFLFYYSSILSISPSLYEAAKLDGASYWQQVRYITLPSIKPIIITIFILGIANIFRSDFGLFYLVTKNSGELYDVTQTIDMFVFNALKGSGDLVQSSAASVIQSLVGFVLVLSANLILRKVDRDNALF